MTGNSDVLDASGASQFLVAIDNGSIAQFGQVLTTSFVRVVDGENINYSGVIHAGLDNSGELIINANSTDLTFSSLLRRQ